MNSEIEKPINDYEIYIKFRSQYDIILDWVKRHQIVAGNANYFLKEDGVDTFINRLAISKAESELFLSRIQPIK
jgi:hypothetical protein